MSGWCFQFCGRIKEKGHEILAPWGQWLCLISLCAHCTNTSQSQHVLSQCWWTQRSKGLARSWPLIRAASIARVQWELSGTVSLCHSFQLNAAQLEASRSPRWVEVGIGGRKAHIRPEHGVFFPTRLCHCSPPSSPLSFHTTAWQVQIPCWDWGPRDWLQVLGAKHLGNTAEDEPSICVRVL